MAETVRVRCAVGRDIEGDYTLLGSNWNTDDGNREMLERLEVGAKFVQWATVEIPLPVEPVVVAEVEAGDER